MICLLALFAGKKPKSKKTDMQTVLLPISFDESNHGEWHISLAKVARFSMKLNLTKEQLKDSIKHLTEDQISFTVQHFANLQRELANNKRKNDLDNPHRSDPNTTTFPTRAYERISTIPIETVFSNMNGTIHVKINDTETTQVIIKSKRYRTFHKKGVKCVRCGIEGHYFAVERQYSQSTAKWHLNLYHLNSLTGKETMMTVDHVQPRSLGGSDRIDNLQPMCCVCNHRKGNIIEEADKPLIAKNEERLKGENICA